MAKRKIGARARANRGARNEAATSNRGVATSGLDATVVPRVLIGVVDGVEIVAVGALQIARDVVVSAVSGAANIGAQAITVTVSGARGIVSATSQMVGDVASAGQRAVVATIQNARRPGRGGMRLTAPSEAASTTETREVTAASERPRARRRTRHLRLASRTSGKSLAA